MVIKQGPSSLFYACPKYDMENLVDDERQCNNRLNLLDHDKMLAHIDKIRYDTELSGEIAQIAHHTWKTSKGIEYKVLSHKGDSLVVGVINKMAINK
jgi:DNA-binding phage protein